MRNMMTVTIKMTERLQSFLCWLARLRWDSDPPVPTNCAINVKRTSELFYHRRPVCSYFKFIFSL